MIYHPWFCVLLVLASTFFCGNCQQYDFAAEITRQCLVPDPVGLLDCVENKVTLPYLTSWVDCTNSLGQNVKTSADIINYRCKSVWEGKAVIPEVFYIKDCVIEKTGLPAKNVSAEVLGAYKECESAPKASQQSIKTAPVQQQQLRVSSVEYRTPQQQFQAPVVQPSQQQQFQPPQQQFQAPVVQPLQQQQFQQPQQQFQAPVVQPLQQQQFRAPVVQPPIQQIQTQITQPQQFQIPLNQPQAQQFRAPIPNFPPQQMQIQTPFQQQQAPVFQAQNAPRQQQFQAQNAPRQQQFQAQNAPRQQQFQIPAPRPIQTQQPAPMQSPIQVSAPRPVQQAQSSSFVQSPQPTRPMTFNQQQVPAGNTQFRPANNGPQYPSLPPQSQQFFIIYPQAPLQNQQMRVNTPTFSQKTANPGFPPQQQISASTPQISAVNPNAPYSYSFQISHPLRSTF